MLSITRKEMVGGKDQSEEQVTLQAFYQWFEVTCAVTVTVTQVKASVYTYLDLHLYMV
jgi:hypothetical protein